jgi:threonine aldolase
VPPRGFASDNYAGIQPAVLAAIAEANDGHAVSYGADPWTERARALLREVFGPDAEAFLVFNGTAANVLCLEALSAPWEAVMCAATSHLHVDECGAPERAGRKLLVAPVPHGKLTPELLDPLAIRFGDEHAIQPGVVSVAQSTELGTVYSLPEVRTLADWAHERGMRLHVDGARLGNAAASLGVSLRELTTDAGVDAVSFGGTKAGLLGGEAVVLLRPGAADGFLYRRKQAMQLASKMRFVAAQFIALLEADRWRVSAAHANAMAARLADAAGAVPGVEITHPVQANAVFAVLPAEATRRLQERFRFYVWDEGTGEVRWMCSWDTTPEDVDAFAAALRELV